MDIAVWAAKSFLSFAIESGRALLGVLVMVVHSFALGLAAVTKTIGLWLNFSFAEEALIYRQNGKTSMFGQAVSLAVFGLVVFAIVWRFL